jgi:hypothetical protein
MEFKQLLEKAALNFKTLNDQARSGISFAQENFSYTRLVSDMDALYKKLLKTSKNK